MTNSRKDKARFALEAAEWLELRAAGLSYRDIALRVSNPATGEGPSHETVRRRVETFLSEHPAPKAEDYRNTQISGYARLAKALSPGVESGDVRAIAEMRKLYEAQARLLGLNAATKTELKVEHTEDPAILQRITAQRLANNQARAALTSGIPVVAPIDVEVVEEP